MHFLVYHYNGGITMGDVERMTREEREWYILRLVKQKEAEAKAIKDAAKR